MTYIKGLFLGLLLFNVGSIYADETEPRHELEVIDQYSSRNKADQEPIERIDPVTGELRLKYTDFTIKGPGGLDINLVRQYRSMSTSEHPYTGLFGMGWRMDFGRLRPASSSGYDPFVGSPYTIGSIFEDQDGISHQFFKKIVDGKPFFISKDNWKLERSVDYSEELKDLGSHQYTSQTGYKITNPDGIVYHAGVSRVEAPDLFGSNPTWYYYVHRIEDKYGNNINIDWTEDPRGFFPALFSEVGPTRIERVGFQSFGGTSSELTFKYQLLQGYFPNQRQPVLSGIYGKTKSVEFTYEDKGFYDGNVGNIFVPITAIFKYRHPTSATAKSYYEKFNYTYYPGSWVSGQCDSCGSYLLKQRKEPSELKVDYKWKYFDLTLNGRKFQAAVSKKTTGGNAQHSGIWQYDYATKYENRFGEISLNTVTTPSKKIQHYYYNHDQSRGNIWRTGLMQKEVIKTLSGQVFQIKEYLYDKQIFINRVYNPYPPRRYDYDYYDQKIYLPLTTQIETIRGGDVFTQKFSNFNTYGAPQTQEEIGPTGETRRTDFSYYINEELWIINQPEDDVISGVGSITRDYNDIGDVERIDKFNQTNFVYKDNDGNLKQTVDANGNKTYYKEYKMGLPQRIDYPENKIVTFGVVFPGVLSWERDGEGHKKYFSYNHDRLTGITPPLGDKFNIDYISCKPYSNENCTGIQITRGTNQKKILYDGYWRKKSVTENGQSHHFEYDAEGRKTFESYLGIATAGLSFQYDVLDRPIKITKPGGVSTIIQYLPGNRVKIIDGNKISITEYYQSYGDPDEKFLERIDTAKNTTWIATDPRGLIKSVQQGKPGNTPNGLKRTYSYNNRRQLIGINNPETGLTTFGRDLAGNMISKKVGSSPVSQFKYDGLHRLKFIQYPSKTNDVKITYNKNDQLKLVDNGTTQRTFGYDNNNNLITEDLSIDSFTFQLDYNYNSRDQLESTEYPSGKLVKYYPDARGRPTRVGSYVNQVTYHPNDIVKQVNYANKTQLFSTYNNRHLVETITIKNPSKTLIDLTYGYDPADNVKTITDKLGTTFDVNLSYDKVYQLDSAKGAWGNGSINYNPYGDITRKQMGPNVLSYTYKNGKLDTLNSIKYLYDAYGNVVSNHRADHYRFGDASELLSANAINYWYDGGNTLVKKQAANGKITYSFYAYKNSKLLAEYDGKGNTIREYAYLKDQLVANVRAAQDSDGDGVDDTKDNCIEIANSNQRDSNGDGYGNVCDADFDGNGSVSFADLNIFKVLFGKPLPVIQPSTENGITYYHWNALSSTVLATDSSGNKAWEENYQPYGKQIKGEEDGRSSVFYTGKHTDRDTGLTYLAARWYDADIGRFISVDPLTFQLDNLKSFGRYVYANNNPYKYVDPTGEAAIDGSESYIGGSTVSCGQRLCNKIGTGPTPVDIVNLALVGVSAAASEFAIPARLFAGLFGNSVRVAATKSTGAFSKVAPATAKQLQKKFKHAGDFGVSGNYNPANAQKFNQAIQKHLNASGTKEIAGTYRGNSVTFHTNPNSGLTAIQNPNGSFLSGWKLNPQQLQHVLKDGKL